MSTAPELSLPSLRYVAMNAALATVAGELARRPDVEGIGLYGPVTYLPDYPASTQLWLTTIATEAAPLEAWQFDHCRVHALFRTPNTANSLVDAAFTERPPLATCAVLLGRTGQLSEVVARQRAVFMQGPSPFATKERTRVRSSISWKLSQARGLVVDIAALRAHVAPALLELFGYVMHLRGQWPLHQWEMILALPHMAPDLHSRFVEILSEPDGGHAWRLAAELCEEHLRDIGGLTKPGEHLIVP